MSNQNGKDERFPKGSATKNNKRRRNRKGHGKNIDSNSNVVANNRDAVSDRVSDTSQGTVERSALNDPSWYLKYPILIDGAARLQFMNRPGDYLGVGGIGMTESSSRDIPGIMRIEYQAAVGSSDDNSSPASICAKGIWDRIRDAYSGSLQADPPDIFMYIMHLDQFQAYIAWLKRIYGILNFYTPFNHYVPITLFKGMFPHTQSGVNSQTFYNWLAHKKDLMNYINQLVYMCNKYVVPYDLAVFDRHRWMNEGIYQDMDSVLSQMYLFVPTGFWSVDYAFSEGTRMVFRKIGTSGNEIRTVDEAFQFGLAMYTQLADWGDAKTINGYIMRAFDGQFYPPATLMTEDYTVRPVHSPEVLLQIHNTRCMYNYTETEWKQNPSTGAIIVTNQGLQYDMDAPIVDIPMDVPDQVTSVIATRLTPVIYTGHDSSARMACGTEVVTGLYMTSRDSSDDTVESIAYRDVSRFAAINYLGDANQRYSNLARTLKKLVDYTAFHFAPLTKLSYSEVGDGADRGNGLLSYVGDLTNSTIVPIDTLQKLHLVCQQSEFGIYNARMI